MYDLNIDEPQGMADHPNSLKNSSTSDICNGGDASSRLTANEIPVHNSNSLAYCRHKSLYTV